MGLRFRIALTIFLLEALLVIAILVTTLRHVQVTIKDQFEASDEVTINLLDDLARIALLTEDFGELQAFIEQASVESRLSSVALADLSGRVLAASDPSRLGTQLDSFTSDRERIIELGRFEYPLGTLAIAFNNAPFRQTLAQAYRQGILIAIAGMVVTALASLVISHVVTRRLSQVTEVADHVARGELAQRVNLKGEDEITRVAHAMNSMLDRLEAQIQDVTLTRDRLYIPTEVMHEGFAIWSPDDRLILHNTRFEQIFNDTLCIRRGMSFREFLEEDACTTIDSEGLSVSDWLDWRFSLHANGNQTFSVKLLNGQWLSIDERALSDGGILTLYNDITESKLREHEVLEGREHLQLIMDSVSDGVMTIDRAGRISDVNRSIEGLLDKPKDALIGTDFFSYFTFEAGKWQDRGALPIAALRGDGTEHRIEATGHRRSGKFPVDLSIREVGWRGQPMFIVTMRDITEERKAHSLIVHQATHDVLTGLPNRALVIERIEHAILNAQRSGTLLAALFLDIDHFKSINDTLGHTIGDDLLVHVAQRLRATVRQSDTVARMGGDEFLILVGNARRRRDLRTLSQKVLRELSAPFQLQGRTVYIRASLGIAIFPEDAQNRTELLKHADTALHRAKEQGRNRFALFDKQMGAKSDERVLLEVDLRNALAHHSLYLTYQAQFDITNHDIIGIEALARWRHPDRGHVPPSQFIPVAEECGLIMELGLWAVRQACHDLISWRRQGISVGRMAVNVSPRQLGNEFLDEVTQILEDNALAPHHLELELTETALIQDHQPATSIINRLSDLGVGLALDDFGTGYSSLSYLRRYPIQRVKIDRNFVRHVVHHTDDESVVRAVAGLCHGLAMRVVAEGIESEDQLERVRNLGCDEGQGFFLARPTRAKNVPALFAQSDQAYKVG